MFHQSSLVYLGLRVDSRRYTITLKACLRYVPPTGLGIMPLLVVLASPIHISAILFLVQALQRIPTTSLSILAAWFLYLFSLKYLVRLLTTKSLMSWFLLMKPAACFATANWCFWL